MSSTHCATYRYSERAQLIEEAFDRRVCLEIKDICEIICKGVSVARQLVREMEAAGDLVIVMQGFRRLYFRNWPTPDQIPKRSELPKMKRGEGYREKGLVMLRSPEERKGNTRADECRQFNGINLRVTQLLREASQRAA